MNDLKGIIEDCNKSDLISDKVIKKIIEIIGQEEWNDLHDENSDICTTMGELIITLKGIPELENKIADIKANCDLAIEGRDVKVMELEKENERLTVSYETLKLHDEEEIGMLKSENAKLKEDYECLEDAHNVLNELYEKLEKENAELKKRVDNLYNSDCWASDQLTKAKDHIKKLLDCLKQDTNDPQTNYYVCQYMDKAEQFLREIEK